MGRGRGRGAAGRARRRVQRCNRVLRPRHCSEEFAARGSSTGAASRWYVELCACYTNVLVAAQCELGGASSAAHTANHSHWFSPPPAPAGVCNQNPMQRTRPVPRRTRLTQSTSSGCSQSESDSQTLPLSPCCAPPCSACSAGPCSAGAAPTARRPPPKRMQAKAAPAEREKRGHLRVVRMTVGVGAACRRPPAP